MEILSEYPEATILRALKQYDAAKKSKQRYIQTHMDEHLETCRRSYRKMREDPDKLERFKARQREAARRYYAKKKEQKAELSPVLMDV